MINAGKESLALDLETPDGAVELRSLLASTDLVIEDIGLFDGDAAPLSWEEAVNVNASLVALSLSPFGWTRRVGCGSSKGVTIRTDQQQARRLAELSRHWKSGTGTAYSNMSRSSPISCCS